MLAGVVGLIGAWLVLNVTTWNLGLTMPDLGFPAVIPDDPRIVLERAITEVQVRSRIPDGLAMAEIREAAEREPMGETYLMLAALSPPLAQSDDVEEILIEARRRNPASRVVRLALLDRFIKEQNTNGAVGEIGALSSILPAESKKELAKLLIAIVAAPETRQAAISSLKASPMRKSLVSDLAKAGASSYLLLDLLKDLDFDSTDPDQRNWTRSVTLPLVEQGDLVGALRVWRHFYDKVTTRTGSGLVDPNFEGKAAAPFGWETFSSAAGTAEFADEGLRVVYEGQDRMLLARQLTLLPAGRYSLDYKLTPAKGQPPSLSWRVECLGAGGRLLDFSVNPLFVFEAEAEPFFTVPQSGCPGQWISISGTPLPVPSLRTATISRVDLRSRDTR